jgi:hypothetical protein
MLRQPVTLQLKSGDCYRAHRRPATALPGFHPTSSLIGYGCFLFFLRLGRCLLWLLRCWCWALFKDNLSFPGNVGADDLLSQILQIEFDIRDSLFQGFVFIWHMIVLI